MKSTEVVGLMLVTASFAVAGTLGVQTMRHDSARQIQTTTVQQPLSPRQQEAQAAVNKDIDAYMRLIGGTAEQQLAIPMPPKESGWQWKLQHKEAFQMTAKQEFTVWQVPPQTGRDSGTLIRLVIEADFPVHLAFMDGGTNGITVGSDVSSKSNTCTFVSVMRLDAVCNVTSNDANRVLVIQDANEAFLVSGEGANHESNNVHISLFEYSWLGKP